MSTCTAVAAQRCINSMVAVQGRVASSDVKMQKAHLSRDQQWAAAQGEVAAAVRAIRVRLRQHRRRPPSCGCTTSRGRNGRNGTDRRQAGKPSSPNIHRQSNSWGLPRRSAETALCHRGSHLPAAGCHPAAVLRLVRHRSCRLQTQRGLGERARLSRAPATVYVAALRRRCRRPAPGDGEAQPVSSPIST